MVTRNPEIVGFLAKAAENLASAASEFVSGRHNACANRCYYSAFQAAVAALMDEGIHPQGSRAMWGHAFVQAQFAGQLVNRRKLYPPRLRDELPRLLAVRLKADYEPNDVSRVQAGRARDRSTEFLSTIRRRLDRT